MIKGGSGGLRLLYAIFVKFKILPSRLAKMSYLERAFVKAATLALLEEENKSRR